MAYLLSKGGPGQFELPDPSAHGLYALVRLYLQKSLSGTETEAALANRVYPIPADQIKSDEIELVTADGSPADEDAWQRMKLNYVGRRTISRYGCYGCHDIPGFKKARPIGTALQDWGRKDTSKLAFEHIHEWLHHHGEPDGSSTLDRAEDAIKGAQGGGIAAEFFEGSKDVEEKEMAAAYFYNSVTSHGRPGFIWQKLRQPRSYDYEKVET